MKKIFLLCALCIGFSSLSQELSDKEKKDFIKKINAQVKTIQTIKTDFIQTKSLSFLQNKVTSEGKMYVVKEGPLKWAYTTPNNYSIIIKNDEIYINDNGDKSKVDVNQKIFKKISKLVAGSINGNLFNDDEFKATFYSEGSYIKVQLLPTEKMIQKYIQKIVLYFPKNDSFVEKVKMIEPSGDYTEIIFKNRKINAQFSDDVFKH